MKHNTEIPNSRNRRNTFHQDGARAHNAKTTLEYLDLNVPEYIPHEMWPLNSPGFNPCDYNAKSSSEQRVFRWGKVQDVENLKR